MQEISKKLGENLKKVRAKKKLLQEALERLLGVDNGYINNIRVVIRILLLRQFKDWRKHLVFQLMNY